MANHTSYLDAPLLWAFLPGELTFAISTQVVKGLWLRPFLKLVRVLPMDPTNPLSSKALIRTSRPSL
ncbi:MAG: 1-acyl-sn-glycerol-3-phosphate acyltransferase [Gammaproteobacteria bacterium]